MKMTSWPILRLLAAKPWLLAVFMFLIVIAMWVTVYTISVKNPAVRMDEEAERALLEKRK